ncbi:hypothetical protein MMC07_001810 [Pseudocyphellaria aurata]|nr:hypothetical protein [Pseudocyphellaria aurata]
MHIPNIPFFRIFYSTTFTILTILLAGLVLITPVDQVYQAFRNRQIFNIFFITGTHLLTLAVAIFIYASRLFTNRSVLAAIPKCSSPIEKGLIQGKRMQRLVAEHLKRSAVTAYEAHPRNLEDDQTTATGGIDLPPATVPAVEAASPRAVPVWGIISHPGWSSPSSIDLPNLHYDPVIIELPHLIEAKAVSLAPPDPLFTPFPPNNENEPSDSPLPDALAVELLQRPASMGLRDYVSHLTSLAMIHPPTLGGSFLALYEKARFSGRPLDEAEFRALMHVFAEILRGMTVLSLDIVAELRAEEEREEEETWSDRTRSDSDADDGSSLRTSATVEYTPRPDVDASESISSSISSSSRSSHPRPSPRRRGTSSPPPRRTYHKRNNVAPSPSPLERSFRRQRSGVVRPPSVSSMWSQASSQRSGGSVIHLSEARGALDLPYTIVTKS